MATEDPYAELRRRFAAATRGAELADLRALADRLLPPLPPTAGHATPRPERRRPPLPGPHLLRVRIDVDDAAEPLWRRLFLRNDTPLDVVHHAIMAAFGQPDWHLFRFSVGGDAYDWSSQLFTCHFDLVELESDQGGIDAAEVRLDETLQQPGDTMAYRYEAPRRDCPMTLRLEAIAPCPPDAPIARVVGGPEYVDVDAVNAVLLDPHFALRKLLVDPRLIDLMDRLAGTDVGADLAARTLYLTGPEPRLNAAEVAAALAAFHWVLDRAVAGGIALTEAQDLTPPDVAAVGALLPAEGDTSDVDPERVRTFVGYLRALGFVTVTPGRLVIDLSGRHAQSEPVHLWKLLGDRLTTRSEHAPDAAVSLVLLAYAASSGGVPLPTDQILAALEALGWRDPDGRPATAELLREHDLMQVLRFVGPGTDAGGPVARADVVVVSPVAAALARTVVRRPVPDPDDPWPDDDDPWPPDDDDPWPPDDDAYPDDADAPDAPDAYPPPPR